MKTHVIRLTKGMDLKKELIKYTKEKEIKAGIILSCVGCLTKATLRMANATIIKEFPKNYEIISLEGILSLNGVHLHIALSDEKGQSIGGHLMENSLVSYTAEVVIGELDDYEFRREFDKNTGYKELKITKLN